MESAAYEGEQRAGLQTDPCARAQRMEFGPQVVLCIFATRFEAAGRRKKWDGCCSISCVKRSSAAEVPFGFTPQANDFHNLANLLTKSRPYSKAWPM